LHQRQANDAAARAHARRFQPVLGEAKGQRLADVVLAVHQSAVAIKNDEERITRHLSAAVLTYAVMRAAPWAFSGGARRGGCCAWQAGGPSHSPRRCGA